MLTLTTPNLCVRKKKGKRTIKWAVKQLKTKQFQFEWMTNITIEQKRNKCKEDTSVTISQASMLP
uniref:Uncharacterized protein n=1 Tax=Arundo donax TaxID=35708 RepID=A0A0A8ZFG3_ARUDO